MGSLHRLGRGPFRPRSGQEDVGRRGSLAHRATHGSRCRKEGKNVICLVSSWPGSHLDLTSAWTSTTQGSALPAQQWEVRFRPGLVSAPLLRWALGWPSDKGPDLGLERMTFQPTIYVHLPVSLQCLRLLP